MLSAAAGGLLGLWRTCQRHPERVQEAAVDELAEAALRLLGVPAPEAARLVALPPPPTDTGNRSQTMDRAPLRSHGVSNG